MALGEAVDVGKRLMRYSQKSTRPHPVIGEILVNADKIKTRDRDLGQVLAIEIFISGDRANCLNDQFSEVISLHRKWSEISLDFQKA